MSKKYTIGVDFGTQSGRALLVEVATGREVATAIKEYPHGVMDEYLPDGTTRLDDVWARQHPQDYIDVLKEAIPRVLKESGVDPENVIGVGVDFTACTLIPVGEEGIPLCFHDEYKSNPHAYVKLWKHHAAQDKANKINDIAKKRAEEFLNLYGGKVSSEWLFPKLWQMLDEAPDLYKRAAKFIEAADWVVMQLTGEEKRNSCAAGYKAMWHKHKGYPSNEFFKTLDPRLENVVDQKLSRDIYPIGTKAGELTEEAARLTGLMQGTAVAVGNVDAHVAVPAVGIVEEGKMLMIMGTSTCHIILAKEEKIVPGICGVVEDGVIPGFRL